MFYTKSMPNSTIVDRLKADLLDARKARDQIKVDALQSALSSITNAEAIPVDRPQNHVNVGLGSSEAARHILSEEEIRHIIQDEIDELQNAITSMSAYPDSQYATDLKQKVQILKPYITSNN